MNFLPVPAAAEINADSTEILRLWKVPDVGQQVILRHDAWEDPAAWGLMLADIARHVARAHGQEGQDEEEILQRILVGFRAEIESPTDTPRGELHEE
jgi:Domain of unknown function (DUF5076)